MINLFGSWMDLFRALGKAILEVFEAELDALGTDLSESGRRLALALGFFGAVAMVFFWTVALLLYTLIHVLALWVPLWFASVIVLGLSLVVLGVLGGIGYFHLKRFENPVETVRRRVGEHRRWWEREMLPDEAPDAAGERDVEEERW